MLLFLEISKITQSKNSYKSSKVVLHQNFIKNKVFVSKN